MALSGSLQRPFRFLCCFGLILAGAFSEVLRAESLIVVDAGFVELEGYAGAAGDESEIRPTAELAALSKLIFANREEVEAAARSFLDDLLSVASGIERFDLAGGSLNRRNLDPERILLWMTTVRHISRTFDDRQPRPELHFEFYLINPASQLIAFKQSVTVSLREVMLSKMSAQSVQSLGPALERALDAEKGVGKRFLAAIKNYEQRGAARMSYAVSPGEIRFSSRLEQAFLTLSDASGRCGDQISADARLTVATELNTIYSDEGLMLPVLPADAMALLRQGEVSGRSLWMRFNCDAVVLHDLPEGAFEYDRSSDLVMISAELPVPDFVIGCEVDYFEDAARARRSPVPPALYPPGLMSAKIEKRLRGSERKLPLGELSGNANPRYGGAGPPKILLRGFSAALRSLYRSKSLTSNTRL